MDDLKSQFRKIALQTLPNESCGFVYKVNDYFEAIEVKNVAQFPRDEFIIDPNFNNQIEGKELIGYFHSHAVKHEISPLDKSNAEDHDIDCYVYFVEPNEVIVYKKTGFIQPLSNRDFQWGVSDCWILARDYYKQHYGFSLDHGPLRTSNDDVIKNNLGLWFKNYTETCGFFVKKEKRIEKLQPNDFILMNLNANQVNHCGIYLGDNVILHHLQLKNSCKSYLGSYYKNRIVAIYSPVKV